MNRLLKSVRKRLKKLAQKMVKSLEDPPPDWREVVEQRIIRLRKRGVRIGEGCQIYTEAFSTEPWLVEIGNKVGVAGGTIFLTHDGSVGLIWDKRKSAQHCGRIVVSKNTVIGENCILLPGTRIGENCIIGAGTTVRGTIPDNSLVVGNPGKIIGKASVHLARILTSPNTLDSLHLPEKERRSLIEAHFGIT